MKIKAVIFGSTGMIGKSVLLECLENPNVESILAVNRHLIGIKHPKLQEVIHHDFYNLSSIAYLFAEFNTCFFCLGISAFRLPEEEYKKITYDLTMEAAKTLLSVNKNYTFCYISGAGTDNTEKGNAMWARVKGKTENALLAFGFKNAYMFRPGYIQPMKGVKSKTAWYNFFYFFFKPFYFLLKPFKGLVTSTDALSKAMINVVLKGYNKNIIESTDINKLAKL